MVDLHCIVFNKKTVIELFSPLVVYFREKFTQWSVNLHTNNDVVFSGG